MPTFFTHQKRKHYELLGFSSEIGGTNRGHVRFQCKLWSWNEGAVGPVLKGIPSD